MSSPVGLSPNRKQTCSPNANRPWGHRPQALAAFFERKLERTTLQNIYCVALLAKLMELHKCDGVLPRGECGFAYSLLRKAAHTQYKRIYRRAELTRGNTPRRQSVAIQYKKKPPFCKAKQRDNIILIFQFFLLSAPLWRLRASALCDSPD